MSNVRRGKASTNVRIVRAYLDKWGEAYISAPHPLKTSYSKFAKWSPPSSPMTSADHSGVFEGHWKGNAVWLVSHQPASLSERLPCPGTAIHTPLTLVDQPHPRLGNQAPGIGHPYHHPTIPIPLWVLSPSLVPSPRSTMRHKNCGV